MEVIFCDKDQWRLLINAVALSLMAVVVDGGENPHLQRRLLRVAVAARYAQSLVMGAYSYSQVSNHPFLWVWSILALCPK